MASVKFWKLFHDSMCMRGRECVHGRVHACIHMLCSESIPSLRHTRQTLYTELHSKLYLIVMFNYTHNLEIRINAWTNDCTLNRWQYVILCVIMGNFFIDYSQLSRENNVISLIRESIRITQKKLENRRKQLSFLQCISTQWNALDHSEYNVKGKL